MLDLVCFALLGLAFFRGWQKGIVVALFSLLGIVLGMMAALKLSGLLGNWLLEQGWVRSGWGQIISYILLFIVVFLLVRLLAKAVEGMLQAAFLGIFNRIMGAAVYVFLAAFVLSCLLWVADQAHFISPGTKVHSYCVKWFTPVAPWVLDHVGAVLPFAKNIFKELSQFFERVNEHLSSHVGAH
ncbi:MAG: CvpA family protein [Bacteroidetes bacterium]|nr:CvpA family protein [Bacteroidota bacterium]MBS1629677.1 CvpA family protein [Bacteroidota bacterium]